MYDYIVVGAGSAGCAVANRLSASSANKVLLLEAGPEDKSMWVKIPMGIRELMGDPKLGFTDQTVPTQAFAGRSITLMQGRMMGGSSSLNGMMYVRGDARDYDTWARDFGCEGWSWDEVLPYFRKSENNPELPAATHGHDGPLRTSVRRDIQPVTRALIDSCVAHGLARNDDTNSGDQEGIGYCQQSTRGGERWSSARSFIHDIRKRANLTVRTEAPIDKVLIEAGRAVGVRLVSGEEIRAGREVILSAGALSSPQILQRSGIGDPAHLAPLGIDTVVNCPDVGANFHDHLFAHVKLSVKSKAYSLNSAFGHMPYMVWQLLKWQMTRRGLFSMPAADVLGFFRTQPDLPGCDIQLSMLPVYFEIKQDSSVDVPRDPSGITVSMIITQPKSRGSVRITSADANTRGTVDPNYLAVQDDVDTLIRGIRLMRDVATKGPLAEIVSGELKPGADLQSDAELDGYVRRSADTVWHPVGTCRMGGDAGSVTDPRLRVRNVTGLRVADASVMPRIISGNTNAPAIMIGEKCADMVLEDQA